MSKTRVPGRRCGWLALLALVAGCGPSLRFVDDSQHAFRATIACTQGPLQMQDRALGSRWGEQWILEAVSPRSLRGQFEARLDGQLIGGGWWSTTHTMPAPGSTHGETIQVADTQADNRRCMERPVPLAPQGQVALQPPDPVMAPPPPAGGYAPIVESLPAVPEPLPVRVGVAVPAGPAILVEVATGLAAGTRQVHFGRWQWQDEDPDGHAPLKAGAELRVRIWSHEPMDLEGVIFHLRHFVARSDGTDAEWLAYLRKKKQEREADAQRDRQTAATTSGTSRRPTPPDPDEGNRPTFQAHYLAQPPAQTVPQPRQPNGPPPAAPEETPPPRPSDNAEWVAGYWQWTGFTWFWLGAWWRVPEADRNAGMTATAPTAPPRVRLEAVTPPPFAGALWVSGWWAWNGRLWLWVPGAWRVAPAGTVHWRAPLWLPHGVGVRLDPGGWTIRLR